MRMLAALLICLPAWGQNFSTQIEAGHTYQRSLFPDQTDSLLFQSVPNQEIVSIKIAPQTADELICRFYSPSGVFRRAFSTTLRTNPIFTFAAVEPGLWRLEISPRRPGTAPISYVVSGLQFSPLTLAEPRPSTAFQSPRLNAIRSSADVAAFWKEMEAATTPLIEPIPGSPDLRLLTFVWRGEPDTRSVYVAFKGCWEIEDCLLSQLRDTGIWYRSFHVDRRVRTTYRFAPNLPPPSRMSEGAMGALLQRDPLNPKAYGVIHDNPDEVLHRASRSSKCPTLRLNRGSCFIPTRHRERSRCANSQAGY